jgi:hypothetical protein
LRLAGHHPEAVLSDFHLYSQQVPVLQPGRLPLVTQAAMAIWWVPE